MIQRHPSSVVDVENFNQAMIDFLISRGFTERTITKHTKWGDPEPETTWGYPGCKNIHRHVGIKNSVRIFFPSNDEALIFTMVFGNEIFSSTIKQQQEGYGR